MMTQAISERKQPPVAPTTGGPSKTVEAIDNRLIANPGNDDNRVVAFRAAGGATWSYRGKRGRVLAMLAQTPEGVTQWDTLPWHTRLGGNIHALRRAGLTISTEIEGRYRHARYRLATPGSVIIHRENTEAAA